MKINPIIFKEIVRNMRVAQRNQKRFCTNNAAEAIHKAHQKATGKAELLVDKVLVDYNKAVDTHQVGLNLFDFYFLEEFNTLRKKQLSQTPPTPKELLEFDKIYFPDFFKKAPIFLLACKIDEQILACYQI
jgi:hypothetical protein